TQEARMEAEGWSGSFGAVASGGAFWSNNDFSYLDDNATFADPTDDEVVERVNAEVGQGHGFFAGSLESGSHRVAALLFLLHQDRGLPGPATVVSRESRQERTRLFASLGYRVDATWGDVDVEGFATLALGYDRDQVRDLLGRVGLGREDTDDRYLSLDARAGFFARVVPPLTLGATVFRRWDDVRPSNRFATPGDQPSERDLTVVATEALLEAEPFGVPVSARASASLQVTSARLTASELQGTTVRELDQTSPNFRVELRAELLHGLELSGHLSSGAQVPTVLQLFGNRDTVVGNPDLIPETSLAVDAGVLFQRGFGPLDLRSELRFFSLRVDDIIVARRTARNTVAFRNERSGETRGLEAALSLALHPGLTTDASLTYLSSDFDNSGFTREQPLRVPLRYFQRVRWEFLARRLAVWSEIDHRSGFFTDSANQVEQLPLTLINVGLRARSPEDGLSIAVSVMNLLDASGLDLLAFPRPGRAVQVALEWKESIP
ncbi:MAG: TonB-dependent receptor, partial [Myxococcota bacterium]